MWGVWEVWEVWGEREELERESDRLFSIPCLYQQTFSANPNYQLSIINYPLMNSIPGTFR
ncbi:MULTISPECIES: hypothetical protein [Okeania]|uniref:Uncharacterized protein n=1 Tax=Okeania hirsuta TaxID=1458930 RepID=A0A3N6P920_9CYAN|nr:MULTISPECIES: hypothetical protein [Okeania]NET12803.1 hypothetical protein [Okeania sp. SIO1H6]NET21065.1 hypothetical protein [Okeania sp. SIO1H5]NES88282.1 hypothetical protein [Okeania sp. SIO2B9]NET77828.1 hypothetical protein [Okeania sp. SIO1F9]NET96480.1 hypothetical protein [Okeania sp. SIO1H2]